MDDSSLDDFFAKKDKSKKKSKSSKIPSGDIPEKVEEPAKKEKKKKAKEKTQTSTDATKENQSTGKTEEEWNEVVEEEEKDYSGLRIANLQVIEKETEESEEQTVENEEEEDEEGEVKKRDKGEQGPWGASEGTPQPVATPKPKPAEPQPEDTPKEESKSVGKYVPPSQRAAAAAAASGATPGPTIPTHLRKKKAAPNLRSEEDFPTLGGGFGPFPQDSDPRSFERVQHGGRQVDDPTKSSQQLSLGNKFAALQD